MEVHFPNSFGGSSLGLFDAESPFLQETGGDEAPEEALIQAIWFHQRLLPEHLRDLQGRAVRVWHPGLPTRGAGPDFRQATLQWAGEPPRTGDVEVDRVSGGWTQHGHDRNPTFKRVILQVIWRAPTRAALPETHPPVLALAGALDAPLPEVAASLEGVPAGEIPARLRGACCQPLARLPAGQESILLAQAARWRLEQKSLRFLARARQVGWEGALREGLFRGLGYRPNAWPMQRLAEVLNQKWPGAEKDPLHWQSRLFGLAGLLPQDLKRLDAATAARARALWDNWWRERDAWRDEILPPGLWRRHGLRPANHPDRRLALAAHWLARGALGPQLESWLRNSASEKSQVTDLQSVMGVSSDGFWESRWNWQLPLGGLPGSLALLGRARLLDLGINTVLPWLYARARAADRGPWRMRVEQALGAWPALADNALLREARQRLLGGRGAPGLGGAQVQWGLIQISRQFCARSNARCEGCGFPGVVEGFPAEGADRNIP